MAKTDHFYIRATAPGSVGVTFSQVEIDLGSFVDALGKSVLRIHSISVQVSSASSPGNAPVLASNRSTTLSWQMTTQSQADMVTLNDKSVISTGSLQFANTSTNAGELTNVSELGDRVDQIWVDGYLVAVEQIFLGVEGAAAADWSTPGDAIISVILDCTVEPLNEKAAMALALSQQ